MSKRSLVVVIALALGAAGCTGTKQETGAVIGGILGGIAGSQVGKGTGKTAATIAGTVAGAAVGGGIGRYMDKTDRLKVQQTLEYNRTNEPSSWHNPDTGKDYKVTPTRTYQADNGRYCREYQTEVIIGGERQQAHGTACRQPDGTWEMKQG